MELFELISTMFKPSEFTKTPMHEKGKHFFMINRFSAIKHPVQAAFFNHIRINPAQVVNFWGKSWGQAYSRTPAWMYVKTKKAKEDKKAKQPLADNIIKIYCEQFKMSRRDFDTSVEIIGEPFIQEVKMFETMVSQ